jgi:hypothetical protein
MHEVGGSRHGDVCAEGDVDIGIGIAVYWPFWCSLSLVKGECCDEAFVEVWRRGVNMRQRLLSRT